MTDREKRIMSCVKNEYGFTFIEAEVFVVLLSKYKEDIRKHIQTIINETWNDIIQEEIIV